MRIVIDVGVLAHSRGGVARYTLGLARGVAAAAAADDSVTMVDVPASHAGAAPPSEAREVLRDPLYLRMPLLRRIPLRSGSEARSRSRRLQRLLGETDIYHHGGTQPFYPPSARSVLTLYDTSAWEHPEWHASATLEYCRRERLLVESGSRLLAISDWAAKRAERVLSLPRGSVGVAAGAAGAAFSPGPPSRKILEEHGLEENGFLLHVGSYVPRKNIPMLLAAYRGARDKGLRLPLVMVGAESWGGVKRPEGRGVISLSGTADSALLSLYRGARCLILPSRYEGLGLPVLEALACNTPVVCSDAAALPETLGGHGLLLDPDDTDRWVEALAALSSVEYAGELRELAGRAPARGWADAGRDALAFYREVLSE